MIRLLIRGGKSTKDEYVLVRDLVQSAALEADPVGVLLDTQVQGLPQLTATDVELLNQVGALASIEASDHIQSLVIERYGGVEIPPGVKASHLRPSITCHVVHLALVHALTRQGAPNRIDLTSTPASQYARECVRPSLEYHVPPLLKPLIYELIARFGRFAWLTASRQEYPSLLVLHTHEIGRDFDVDDV